MSKYSKYSQSGKLCILIWPCPTWRLTRVCSNRLQTYILRWGDIYSIRAEVVLTACYWLSGIVNTALGSAAKGR